MGSKVILQTEPVAVQRARDPAPPPAPPPYSPSVTAPPAGLRVPCSTTAAFPTDMAGPAPLKDLDGSPVWVASALFMDGSAVHPCKVARGRVMISFGGVERDHKGRYDILPLTDNMEWVTAGYGEVPKGRRPVEGGFESNGEHLYHALATIDGVQVPGKSGKHLHGANFPWSGVEMVYECGYSILCWK
ncbi:hypothetical protein BMF94_4147 [Rhodotorula taiwanensis]|uniref:Uncharacterized protein n=1 Tax=Rhodotorula taiwanensis TaxID=741276 RepID=A0A2S5B7I6_9BASI|nr:hypothetical protein BMF94_4147 [Rhodotorula taiwanensis]